MGESGSLKPGFELTHGMMEDNVRFVIDLLPTSLLFLQGAANT